MEASMQADGRMGMNMVKEQKLYLMVKSMRENGKPGKDMVKEQKLHMM